MKKFLFITHLTPKAKSSALRLQLKEIMKQSLYNQAYPHWKALWLGETESDDGKIKEVDISGKGALSTVYLREDIQKYLSDCDYIVKLDDDDIIMPGTLQKASEIKFDCYCDRYHVFYDLSSGTLTADRRNWIASTCIHKKEHAFAKLNVGGKAENFIDSVFYGDHGIDWLNYYLSKQIVYSKKNEPIYVRVLSPTSITAGAKTFPVLSVNDVDYDHYKKYLKQFGNWEKLTLTNFFTFEPKLKKVWFDFSGKDQEPLEPPPLIKTLKNNIKKIIGYNLWKRS